jgi:hypothetical protein
MFLLSESERRILELDRHEGLTNGCPWRAEDIDAETGYPAQEAAAPELPP